MAVDLGTAYISLVPTTKDFDKGIKSALDNSVKHADTAGQKMGEKLAATVSQHLDKGGAKAGDAFGKSFTPKVQGAGKNAMQGLAQAMLGGAEGMGSQVGGRFSGGLVSAITRGADGAVAALGKIGVKGSGLGSTLTTAGMVAAGGVALIGTAAVTVGQQLYELGSQWDGIADGITFKTGLIGEALDGVKNSVKNVAADTAAELGDIANIAAALTKGLKIPPGEGLERLTQQIAQYNAAAQENGAEPVNLREFIKAMKQMRFDTDGVDGMIEQFDELYKVTQNTTIPMNSLIENLKTLGPTAQNLKIPATTLVQIIAGMEESGLNAETAMIALRTAWKNLQDDPDPANGFRTKLEEITGLLQSTSDEAQSAGAKMASEFFGNKAGPALADAIRQGNLELENFNTTAGNTGLTVGEMTDATADFSQEWKKFTNFLKTELEPAAAWVFGRINEYMSSTLGVVARNIRDIQSAFEDLTYGGNPGAMPGMAPGPAAAPGILGGAAGIGPGIGANGLAGGNAASAILGGMAGATAGVPGTAGRGYFNSRAAAAYLDQVTGRPSDAAILANVPSGRYDNGAVSDLSQGLADCSSAVEDLVNIIDGRPTTGRSLTTFNAAEWLTSRGFRPGTAPGALNVGFTNAGTPHMEATLPGGTNFNWGNDADAARGGRTSSAGAFSPNLTQRYYRYDEGGVLPPGLTLVQNDTGKPELILNPGQQQALADQGVDPTTLLHGTGNGAAPGPAPNADTTQQQPDYGMDFVRSLGFIPATAGSNTKAGTSSLSKFIDMGSSVVGGLIDTGVNLGNMAISAAIAAGAAGGSFGSAAAAAPAAQMAASYGLQLLGNQGKTIANYWFGLAGIGADALLEQLSPFGAPRWLGYDYAAFMPQLGIQQAALSTVEKMGGDAITKYFAQQGQVPGGQPPMPSPGGPVTPSTMPGAVEPPAPGPESPTNLDPSGPAPDLPPVPSPLNLLPNLMGYDQGGMLPPGGMGINMTNRPEPVLTPQQWEAIAASSSEPSRSGPLVQNLYATDMQEAIRKLEQTKRRDMMQYAGRP